MASGSEDEYGMDDVMGEEIDNLTQQASNDMQIFSGNSIETDSSEDEGAAGDARLQQVSNLSEFLARRLAQGNGTRRHNGHVSHYSADNMDSNSQHEVVDCQRIANIVQETLDALTSSAAQGQDPPSAQTIPPRDPLQHDAFLPHLPMSDTNMVGLLTDSAAAVISSQDQEPLQEDNFITPPPVLFDLGPDDSLL